MSTPLFGDHLRMTSSKDFTGPDAERLRTIFTLVGKARPLTVATHKLKDPVGSFTSIDAWLKEVRSQPLDLQIGLLAQMHAFGDAPERGMAPLRDAVSLQIQAQQAALQAGAEREHGEAMSAAASRISWTGVGVGVVGVVLMAMQVAIAVGWIG